MNKPISVGDLVVIVRPSACPSAPANDSLGYTFVVQQIAVEPGGSCAYCGGVHLHSATHFAVEGRNGWATYRLKRIPPLEELESEKRDEVIHA